MEVHFYITSSGRSPVVEFLNDLSPQIQAEFYDAVLKLTQGELLQMPLSKNLSSVYKGLHELRLKDRMGIYRVFYYMKKGDAIYMLHGFKKKTQRTPLRVLQVTKQRIREL